MFGLSPKDSWLVALVLLSAAAFWAAGRWSGRLADARLVVVYSVGFSLAFVVLALASGLAVLR